MSETNEHQQPNEAMPEHEPSAAEPTEAADPTVADQGSAQAAAEAGGPADAAEVEPEPESELDTARRKRDEYLDLAQRARAELDNFRKRTAAEAATAERRGRSAVVRDLLPALDNLERALLAAGVDPEGKAPSDEPASEEVSAQTALAEGVALVYRELHGGLRKAGVEPFDPTGERFDPETSEAVATSPADGVGAGAVIEVLERGYRIGEQVLRPARVVVSE